VQLELFAPDRTALAEGWEAVSMLHLEHAREIFSHVLRRWPDTDEAREALEWISRGTELMARAAEFPPGERLRCLWEGAMALPASGLASRLRRALLDGILEEMDLTGAGGPNASPCRGEVLLAAGRPGDAARWLFEAAETAPENRELRRLLGSACWQLERRTEARRHWLLFLLELPDPEAREAARSLPDRELARRVAEHGAARGGLEAWLEGVAPLLAPDELPGGGGAEVRLYRHIAEAEAARLRGDLERAVQLREALLRLDPALLRRYMERLGA
jgi:tetratricopeptide (TPR) repeat protein